LTSGRNDPCPCGSGAKYKRCCLSAELEVEQLGAGMERTVKLLGDEIWSSEPDWCLDRLAEFYEGGLEAFGPAGPDADELHRAQLWFLLDCPLPDGDTPLWRLGRELTDRHVELLSRSELRAWRVLEMHDDHRLTGLCPLGGGRSRLELSRQPIGELERGCFIVGRSVPLGPERWVLIGTTTVVERSVAADFEALLARLDAPRGEVWRVHGGVLARAAWTWPEKRDCTVDGEVVQDATIAFALPDPRQALSRLQADRELEPVGELDGDGIRWHWRWHPPAAITPAATPGVHYELCSEDASPQPLLATLEFVPGDDELWVFAPAPARAALAERLLGERLGPLLGSIRSLHVDRRSVLPRWKRLRLEEIAGRIGPPVPGAQQAA
jgi:hypothetical protein